MTKKTRGTVPAFFEGKEVANVPIRVLQ